MSLFEISIAQCKKASRHGFRRLTLINYQENLWNPWFFLI
jgi:hypothetical protein